MGNISTSQGGADWFESRDHRRTLLIPQRTWTFSRISPRSKPKTLVNSVPPLSAYISSTTRWAPSCSHHLTIHRNISLV